MGSKTWNQIRKVPNIIFIIHNILDNTKNENENKVRSISLYVGMR